MVLACWGRAHISSWSVAELQSQFIWLICSWAVESSTSSASLYDIWHMQQIPSSSACGAGLCPALKPAPAPQLPSALIHALPIPLCWSLDEAAAYAKAGDHLWGLMGLSLIKMALGTWLAGSILQIMLIQVRGGRRSLKKFKFGMCRKGNWFSHALSVFFSGGGGMPTQEITGHDFEGSLFWCALPSSKVTAHWFGRSLDGTQGHHSLSFSPELGN